MTKKDYELVGEAICALRGVLEERERRIVAEVIAGKLSYADKTHKFNYDKFYDACGLAK
jgi:hypothetical protein